MSQLSLLAEYPEVKLAPVLPIQSFLMRVCRVGEPEIGPKVDQPELCVDYFWSVIAHQPWFDENKEHFVVLMLNTRLFVSGYALVSIGSINECMAYPREVFRPVIVAGAYAFVAMHNHPSSDPSPSQNDHSLTRKFKECADILNVKMLDHVIAARSATRFDLDNRTRYFSFREAGVL